MVYSNKYSQNINVSSYKDKSPTEFKSSKQNFEKSGIIFTDQVLSTKKLGSSNYHLRSGFKITGKTPSDRLSSYNFNDRDIKKNIENSNCHEEKHKVLDITSKLQEGNSNHLQSQLTIVRDDLNSCVNTFYDYYHKPDMNIVRRSTSNILPNNYPAKDTEIFGSNLDSCVDSQHYHSPHVIELPNRIKNNKPIYGTKRGIDIVGPRTMNSENINRQTPFDLLNSGYDIQSGDDKDYNNKIIEPYTEQVVIQEQEQVVMEEQEQTNSITRPIPCGHHSMKNKNYCDNSKCSLNEYMYKKCDDVYNGKCGTKSQFKSIVDKLDERPHISEFVKHNIIGNNFQNINHTSLYGRNKATFDNKELQNDNLNLNKLRNKSQPNYIVNTNKLRDEFKDNYFKQQTHKIMNNLNNRG